jgi:predicted acylesterase/phospholipase RssA
VPAQRKLGLALSGGGFRASFFHIGVLARLAELDLLRPIEVISTVSGGSIIGAYYYLHLKRLLESKPDGAITTRDYIELVQRVEGEFFNAVENNIRTRILSNLWKNLWMLRKYYSRSDRVSELLDKYFYENVTGQANIPMPDLRIYPKGDREDFHPRRDNAKRAAKVPQLIINATCLNTGHNWHFTATYMGEPVAIDAAKRFFEDVDKNTRLRRLYYYECSTPKIKRLPLRVAVAASAAVPGIFTPLPITDLYPEMTVQLSDGGVHDNQGLAPLLDSEGGGALCDIMIVSDASGQMEDEPHPSPSILSVVPRTNAILMDRVRDLELLALDLLEQNKKIDAVHFLHLKKDLVQPQKTWIGGTVQKQQPAGKPDITLYDVDRNVQTLLARMRTDLDSFSEVEAFSLMCDAYLMTDKQLPESLVKDTHKQLKLKNATVEPAFSNQWGFLAAKECLYKDAGLRKFNRQLRVSREKAFKVFRLLPWLNAGWVIVLGGLLWALGSYLSDNWEVPLGTWFGGTTLGDVLQWILLLIVVLLGAAVPRTKTFRNRWRETLVQVIIALFGFLISNFHLYFLDPLFKWQGRIKRLANRTS